jgi:hypothetical protein
MRKISHSLVRLNSPVARLQGLRRGLRKHLLPATALGIALIMPRGDHSLGEIIVQLRRRRRITATLLHTDRLLRVFASAPSKDHAFQ